MQHQHTEEEQRETILHLPKREAEEAQTDASAVLDACAGEEATQDAAAMPSFPSALATETDAQLRWIRRIRRKLPRHSFLPLLDAYWRNPGPLNDEKFRAVLTGLCNPLPSAWRERMLCAWLLGHAPLTPEQRVEAANALGDIVYQRRGQAKPFGAHLWTASVWTVPLAGVGAVSIAARLIAVSLQYKPIAIDIFLLLYMSVILFLGLLIPTFSLVLLLTIPLSAIRGTRVRTAAMLALSRLQAPEGVGSLARAALDMNAGIRSVAEEALRRCLPQLTPEHYARLNADTAPALCRLLDVKKERLFANHTHTELLVLDVLTALGKIGDGSAVRHVESVAENGWTESVRQAARTILPLLRERQQQENAPHVLLRGSNSPQTTAEQLLRVPLTTPTASADQLLRSVGVSPTTNESMLGQE